MGWETDFTTSLAFRSLEVTPSPVVDQPSSDKSERWDPSLASLFRPNHHNHNYNVEPSSRGNFTTSPTAPNMQPAPVFSADDASMGLIGAAVTDSNSPTIHASATSQLGAPSSVGASSTKVSKKRSRASRRPPTTVLEADSANFRSMVQHLTGIPAPPPMLSPSLHHHPSRYDFLGSGLIRPQPSRPLSSFTGAGGFSPLDTPAGALLQYQPSPFTLSGRRLEDHYRHTLPYGSVRPTGSFSDPMNSSNLHQGSQAVKSTSASAGDGGNTLAQGGGFYVGQEGNSNVSSGLLMPSLWELETREGVSFNGRVKREVGVEEPGSGRQITSSWSTSL